MKLMVVALSVLAYASASHVVSPYYAGPQHIPVIGPNGVPVETPSVQKAKAEHFALKAEAQARNGDFWPTTYAAGWTPSFYSGSAVAAPVATPVAVASTPVYTGPQHVPVIGPNGVPVETPSVQKAKAEHFALKAEAHARNGDFWPTATTYAAGWAPSFYSGSAVAAPVATPVAVASNPVYTGPQHVPVIGADGVPVDTPAVQQAKHEHFVAKANEYAKHAVPVVAAAPVVATTGVVAPVAHPVQAYPTTVGVPAVTASGVPLDTPEVVAAKANHFAAYSAAWNHRARRAVYYPTTYGFTHGYAGYPYYY